MKTADAPLSERLGLWFARISTTHRWATIAGFLLVVAAIAIGGTRVGFSTDYRVFFSKADPKLQALQSLEKVFTKTDNIVFVVRQGDDVFTPAALAAVAELTEGGWKLPYATRVDSMQNFQAARSEDEDIIVEPLYSPRTPPDAAAIARIRKTALDEPILVGGLVAADGGAAGVNITLRLPRKGPEEVEKAAKAARDLAQRVRAAHPEVEIKVSGMAMMNDAFMAASIQDMSFVFPLMAAVMLAAMWLLLGGVYPTFTVVALIAASSAAALGMAGWMGYPLTPPSAASPTIVLTLAVADGVHIIVSTNHAMHRGMSQQDAIAESLRINLRPVFLTSLTTMIGFLCLNFADAPPFWHLANMTAVGIVVALLGSVTLLPAMLSLTTLRPRASAQIGSLFAEGLSRFVLRARRPLLVGGLLVTGGLGYAATTLESNDQFVEYFDDSIEFRPHTEFLMTHLSGIYELEYRISADGPAGISEPAYQTDLDRFATWARDQLEVAHVYAVSDIIKRVNQAMGDGYRIPKSRPLTAEALLVYEMSLPAGLDMTDRINIDKSSSRVTITVSNLTSGELRAFADRSEAWLKTNTPEARWAKASSPAVIFAHLSDRNTRAMMQGNILSLLLISLCLVVALRSPKLGLLSTIPNLMPIAMAYGLWALFVGEVNIVASVAGAVALGIIVDDTIHFLNKYQLARRGHPDRATAVRITLANVSPALIVTTIVLLGGFGVLTLSAFQMTSDLGYITALVCVAGLLADLLVLPALLLVGTRSTEEST